MESFQEYIREYKRQMEKGEIQEAYKRLMEYLMDLRTHLKTTYPDYFVSGMYYGYMDMTYFSFSPQSFRQRKLKIAIVFIHDTCRFEAWLAGSNKQIQIQYWNLFKESDWKKYHLVSSVKGTDSILEYIMVENPDFNDVDRLTEQIERETLIFIRDVESFLSAH